MAEVFKTPETFNWAWQFFSEELGKWIQFDCPECLQLEFNYQAYKIFKENIYKRFEIILGVVDLDVLELVVQNSMKVMKIRRTPTNER